MKNIWKSIVKQRKVIVAITLLLVALSVFYTFKLVDSGKINSDMLSYLPKNTETSKGLEFMTEEFGIKGDGLFVVSAGELGSEDYFSFSQDIKNILEMDGVANIVWYGTMDELDNMDMSGMPENIDLSKLIDTTSIEAFLVHPQEEKPGYNNYVVLVFMDYSPSTPEAFALLSNIEAKFDSRDSALDGGTYTARTILQETLAEAPMYLIVGIAIVLAILLLVTTSFIEPLILLLTLGVSMIINMGTNYFFNEVSIITFAASSILQLGIAMDYAIFFMHRYREERDGGLSPEDSAAVSGKAVFTTLIASSLTTIAGFGALIFMQFTIGLDLGRVIMKGVALSLITVVILQPCLTVMMDKLIKKTAHKALNIPFEKPAGFLIKLRHVILVICVVLLVPAYIGQSSIDYSYFKMFEDPPEPTSQQVLAAELRNQIVIAVPVKPKTGNHKQYIAELREDDNIGNIMGIFEVADIPHTLLTPSVVEKLMAESPYVSSMFAVKGEGRNKVVYTLYTITVKSDSETQASYDTLEHINTVTNKYFDESYSMGMLTGINDMKEVTPKDFFRITFISVGAILLIMGLMLKSFRKAALTVLLIELAIWINFSISFLVGEEVNFMVYLIITSIQLGCTVDYAILIIHNFDEDMRKFKDSRLAAKSAISRSFNPVMTSASIIAGACMGVYLVSKNLVVKDTTYLLARGALISFALVILVMPGLLVFFKKILPLKEELQRMKREILLTKQEFKDAARIKRQKIKEIKKG